jgi:hypothetical protein
MPPGVPMGAALIGGHQQQQAPMMESKIIPRRTVQQALYNAAAVVSQSKATLLNAVAVLSETLMACEDTVEHTENATGNVQVGGDMIPASQLAEKFKLARKEDADAVAKVLVLIRESSERIDVATIEELANRETDE